MCSVQYSAECFCLCRVALLMDIYCRCLPRLRLSCLQHGDGTRPGSEESSPEGESVRIYTPRVEETVLRWGKQRVPPRRDPSHATPCLEQQIEYTNRPLKSRSALESFSFRNVVKDDPGLNNCRSLLPRCKGFRKTGRRLTRSPRRVDGKGAGMGSRGLTRSVRSS